MYKHYLMWKLKSSVENKTKPEIAKIVKEKVDELPGKVKEIKRLESGINTAVVENAYDIVVYLEFATKPDFLTFLEHPAHKELGAFLGKYREDWTVVDFEV